MPASKQFFLSSGNALAVIATMNTRALGYFSLIIFVVCTPSKIGLLIQLDLLYVYIGHIHLNVHHNHIRHAGFLDNLKRFSAIISNGHRVSQMLEHSAYHFLINYIIY